MDDKKNDFYSIEKTNLKIETSNTKLNGGAQTDKYLKFNELPSEKSKNIMKTTQENNDMKKAISNSMMTNVKPKFQDKSDKTVQRKGTQKFIGMANLGNTCYFNSMMQILYFSDCFANKVCQFDPEMIDFNKAIKKNKVPTEEELHKLKMKKKYIENGVKLISEIQEMFGKMLRGKINYVNPQGVLDHLMEKMTNRKVEVGLQKDLVEFLGMFFECLEAGVSLDKKVSLVC